MQLVEVAQESDCSVLNIQPQTLRRKAAIIQHFLRTNGTAISDVRPSQVRQALSTSLRRLRRLTYLTQFAQHSYLQRIIHKEEGSGRPCRQGRRLQVMQSLGRPLVMSDKDFSTRFPRYNKWLKRQLRRELYDSAEGIRLRQAVEAQMGPYTVMVSEEELYDMLDMSDWLQQRAINRLGRLVDAVP